MKTPNTLYSRLALITSVTLITGYLIVSAVWTDMGSVGTGDQLSATLWNTLVANVNDLDTRLKSTASTWPTVTGGIAYTGGNVGIGTVSPLRAFHVKSAAGTAQIESTGTISNLYFGDTTSSVIDNQGIGSRGNNIAIMAGGYDKLTVLSTGNVGIGTTNPGEYRTAIRGSTDDNTASALWVSGASSLTGALVVRNDGNVGIGTASPVMKLQVVPNVNQYGLGIIGNNTVGQSYGQYIMAGTNSSDAAFRVVNQAQNAEYMYIRGDGNIGIGTTTPGVKLEVNGSIKAAGLWDLDSTYFVNPDASGTAGAFNGSVGIGTASPTGKLHILSSGSSIIRLDRGLNLMGFEASSVAAGGFGLFDYSTSAFQWYAKNGNVGIGTTTPEANLQVNSPTGGTIRLQYTGNSGFARLTTDAANSLILGTVNSLSSVFIQDITGNVGIGTVSPGNFKLKVDGGPLGVYHSQNTNSVLQVVGKDAPSSATFLAVMASGNGADNEFIFQSDGTAKADGTWNGGGADYAEWFEKEGDILGGALIGLNAETGKVRTWQKGDIFMGIQSLNPGFIGNNIHGAETKEADMVKTHVLVALVGQVEVKSGDIIETGRRIMTTDGQFIGLRLSNGNVFIK